MPELRSVGYWLGDVKYRVKMATKKGTTQHGYESNIRAHYLAHFGDWLLAEINVEAVQ
jgi:hypothetical protein